MIQTLTFLTVGMASLAGHAQALQPVQLLTTYDQAEQFGRTSRESFGSFVVPGGQLILDTKSEGNPVDLLFRFDKRDLEGAKRVYMASAAAPHAPTFLGRIQRLNGELQGTVFFADLGFNGHTQGRRLEGLFGNYALVVDYGGGRLKSVKTFVALGGLYGTTPSSIVDARPVPGSIPESKCLRELRIAYTGARNAIGCAAIGHVIRKHPNGAAVAFKTERATRVSLGVLAAGTAQDSKIKVQVTYNGRVIKDVNDASPDTLNLKGPARVLYRNIRYLGAGTYTLRYGKNLETSYSLEVK